MSANPFEYTDQNSITFSYHDDLIGYTSLTMLESEWRQTIKEWRQQKTLPKEVIDEMEKRIEQARAVWIDNNILQEDDSDLEIF